MTYTKVLSVVCHIMFSSYKLSFFITIDNWKRKVMNIGPILLNLNLNVNSKSGNCHIAGMWCVSVSINSLWAGQPFQLALKFLC